MVLHLTFQHYNIQYYTSFLHLLHLIMQLFDPTHLVKYHVLLTAVLRREVASTVSAQNCSPVCQECIGPPAMGAIVCWVAAAAK